MFHIAGVVFVAPLALLHAIRDVKAVRAKVVIAVPEHGVVALAIAAVGGLPAIVPVLDADVRCIVIYQRIHQMLWLDGFPAVLARRIALVRNDDGFTAMWAFELDLGFGVIADQAAQRRDLIVDGIGDASLEATGAACFRCVARLAGGIQFGLERLELGGQVFPVPLHRLIRVGDLAAKVVEVAVPPVQQAVEVKPRAAMLGDDLRLGLFVAVHLRVEEVNHLVTMIRQRAKAGVGVVADVLARDIPNPRPGIF